MKLDVTMKGMMDVDYMCTFSSQFILISSINPGTGVTTQRLL